MNRRVRNFNPGPAALPEEVLLEAKEEMTDYRGTGMSIMEMSHRSPEYEELHEETMTLLLELLGLPAGYRVVFMGGGASTQFALIPLNWLRTGQSASYVLTGTFSEKAYQEAAAVGEAAIAATTKSTGWSRLPDAGQIAIAPNSAYVHMTSNNTIEGSQFAQFLDTGDIPLIADMTSDILGRDIDVSKLSMLYAGAQKNIGPAGLTVAVIRDDFLERASVSIPSMLQYKTYVNQKSLMNTPSVFAVYMANKVLKWTKRQGGAAAMKRTNERKAAALYSQIDASGGFYRGIVEKPFRSIMNVTWRLAGEELEARFVREAEQQGLVGLAGHRSVGGLRASIYNGVPAGACEELAVFMAEFVRRNG